MSELQEAITEIFRPGGTTAPETRATWEASNRRLFNLADLWFDLTEAQQLELIATAKQMLA